MAISQYVGIYGGGGYEWRQYDNLEIAKGTRGAYINAGLHIGYRAFYVDAGYRYSLHQDNLAPIGFHSPINQSMIGITITIPLVELIVDMLNDWSHPTNSREFQNCMSRFGDADFCLRITR
ncbi:hypothetical protein BKN38_02855 [Helicobacter sp. CLO-3]|uniref:hypothetical protein n=1 Tax=unclassified Helicobacter TaxID=2593540 RepID=UPI000805E35E|nr:MULTISPECIES: hypothetical protein [unclassified Helicobacter]OBV29552.1 hypothetical protein BA723_05025 [Helicobacter sp. CLO-3]OHU84539.1 hypothetical protein BKN38_02855 [Helicobacter sp. CLO-3]